MDEVLNECADIAVGHVADYIPQLSEVDPSLYALAVCTVDGHLYHVGDAGTEFTMQSIAKPFTYALALHDQGLEGVLEKVDVEPSGEAYNEISLEPDSGRPRNPMINAGALATYALVHGSDAAHRRQRVLDFYSAVAGRDLELNGDVLDSELKTAFRNRAIAYLLRNAEIIGGDPGEVVDGYSAQCSVSVTVDDLAVMAATLANGGVNPVTHAHVVEPGAVRQTLSVMLTCGMYDSAGDWVTSVGIPAKSGVSGAILGVLPGQVGIAVYSPPLDKHGNSVRGVVTFERLSADMGLHIMSGPKATSGVMSEAYVADLADGAGQVSVYEIQGDIRFAGAELIAREFIDNPPQTSRVMIDVSRAGGFDDVARRIIREVLRRLMSQQDRDVYLVDPDEYLGAYSEEEEPGDGADVPEMLAEAGDLINE
ncbi:glutaminase A [Pseudactinotalea sp. Z1739]|uniref:glutaminase A n=1 Tax=Pseudactinotalea sp. Z1739 TaxID=3413028 RepID=UPI003C79EA34